MKKMKIKLRSRAVVAAGMAVMLSLTAVSSVNAAIEIKENGSFTGEESIILQQGEGRLSDTPTSETNTNSQQGSEIEAKVPYSFTISVPKTIVLPNKTAQNGDVSFPEASQPKVQIKECDLAGGQIMTIFVLKDGQPNTKVTLTDHIGRDKHTLDVGLGTATTHTWKVNTNTTKGLRINSGNKVDGAGEFTSGNGSSKEIKINRNDYIYAGNWSGTVTFGVKVSAASTSEE